jgi:hypothetical protein
MSKDERSTVCEQKRVSTKGRFHLEDKLGVALASEGEDSLGAVNVSRLGLSGDGEREHRKSNLRHGRCDGLMAS